MQCVYLLIIYLCRSWVKVAPGSHKRHVNGILGVLCKQHYPGIVTHNGVTGPATSFDHYASAPDAEDRNNRIFNNKAERVKAEFWVSIVITSI
jgi:hypothetical protein